ncbi:uncharacterized protein V1518DRAFT_415545 [Limtongia smithiae]|uniref:uncharacterized protein n=1 Tax=Limtongia smithiae TaxID=1125753 RepID=UPI0034CEB73B
MKRRVDDGADAGELDALFDSDENAPVSKKQRYTAADEDDSDSEDVDELEDGGSDDQDDRDDDDDEVDEEDVDARDSEDEAYDQFQITQTQSEKSHIATAGIILTVELKNFMCHEHLKLDFGPQINFVIGHNGSGKSAILTGITICLGAKATATQRATSIKSLVKEGKTRASVIVELKNEGDGFKRELYGSKISIERQFDIKGVSNYILRSETGAVVAKTRDELVEMMDYFCLMVDNPMTILSQDTARSFLSNATPEEKYALFMKGIRLEDIKRDYDAFRESIDQAHIALNRKHEDYQALKEKKEKAEALYNRSQKHRDYLDKISYLKFQYLWALYDERVLAVHNISEQISTKEEEMKLAETAADEKDKLKEELANQMNEYLTELEQTQEERKRVEANLADSRQIMIADRDKVKEAQGDERDLQEAIRGLERKIDNLDQRIAQERRRLENLDGGQRESLEREKVQIGDLLQQLKMQMSVTEQEKLTASGEFDVLTNNKQRLEVDLRTKQQELNSAQEGLNKMRAVQQKYMSVFGRSIDDVMLAIRRETRFRSPPIGPIGSLVRLKDPSWGPILESYFNKTLDGFAVTCNEDEELLRDILQQFHSFAPIIVRRKVEFDYSSKMPSDQYNTVLNCLEFEDEYVKYVLIDQNAIERVILIPDRQQADSVMYNNPRNVYFCLSRHHKNPRQGYRISHKRGGSSVQPQYGRQEPPRMKTNGKLQLLAYEQDVQAAQQALANVQQDLRVIDQEIQNLRRRRQSVETKLHHLYADKEQAEQRLYAIESKITESDEGSKLRTLEEEREMIEEKLAKHRDMMQGAIAEYQRASAKLHETSDLIERQKMEEAVIDSMQTEIQTNMDQLTMEIANAKVQANHRRNQLASRGRLIEELKKNKDQAILIMDGVKQMCENECATRVDPQGKSSQQLETEVEELRKENARQRATLPKDPTEIVRDYTQTQKEFNLATDELRQLTELYKKIGRSYRSRVDRYFIFRNQICQRAKDIFRRNLNYRGFNGKLFINHENATLHLSVQPLDNGKDGKNGRRNVKTLSGGEKSFTQICLLTSLWDAMNCPLRGLDEFDVFMDAVNRRTSVRMMIATARKAHETQTIFITPQDMGNVGKLDDGVKIIRMADPERSARR